MSCDHSQDTVQAINNNVSHSATDIYVYVCLYACNYNGAILLASIGRGIILKTMSPAKNKLLWVAVSDELTLETILE